MNTTKRRTHQKSVSLVNPPTNTTKRSTRHQKSASMAGPLMVFREETTMNTTKLRTHQKSASMIDPSIILRADATKRVIVDDSLLDFEDETFNEFGDTLSRKDFNNSPVDVINTKGLFSDIVLPFKPEEELNAIAGDCSTLDSSFSASDVEGPTERRSSPSRSRRALRRSSSTPEGTTGPRKKPSNALSRAPSNRKLRVSPTSVAPQEMPCVSSKLSGSRRAIRRCNSSADGVTKPRLCARTSSDRKLRSSVGRDSPSAQVDGRSSRLYARTSSDRKLRSSVGQDAPTASSHRRSNSRGSVSRTQKPLLSESPQGGRSGGLPGFRRCQTDAVVRRSRSGSRSGPGVDRNASAPRRAASPEQQAPIKRKPSSSKRAAPLTRKPVERTKSSGCAQTRIPRNTRRGMMAANRLHLSTTALMRRSVSDGNESNAVAVSELKMELEGNRSRRMLLKKEGSIRKKRSSQSPKRCDSEDVRRSQLQRGLELQACRPMDPYCNNDPAITVTAESLGYGDLEASSVSYEDRLNASCTSRASSIRALRTSALGAMRPILGPQMSFLGAGTKAHKKAQKKKDEDDLFKDDLESEEFC